MIAKEYCKRKYVEYKESHQGTPKKDGFFKFAEIPERQLVSLYGRDAYTKLQEECGDEANKLNLERTPKEKIMRQYGDLALELKELPYSSDWKNRGLKPSPSGLEKPPHYINWSELPSKLSRPKILLAMTKCWT